MQDLVVAAVWITIAWVLLSLPLGICGGALLRYCAMDLAEETDVTASIEPTLELFEPARRVRASEEVA